MVTISSGKNDELNREGYLEEEILPINTHRGRDRRVEDTFREQQLVYFFLKECCRQCGDLRSCNRTPTLEW